MRRQNSWQSNRDSEKNYEKNTNFRFRLPRFLCNFFESSLVRSLGKCWAKVTKPIHVDFTNVNHYMFEIWLLTKRMKGVKSGWSHLHDSRISILPLEMAGFIGIVKKSYIPVYWRNKIGFFFIAEGYWSRRHIQTVCLFMYYLKKKMGRKVERCKMGISAPPPGKVRVQKMLQWPASRTFAHRTLAHDWYFIDQVNRPF